MLLQCEGGDRDGEGLTPAWLRAETLESLVELNELCLGLIAEQAAVHGAAASTLLREVGELWRALDAPARRHAAACPYLLLDAGFADTARWRPAVAARVGDAAGSYGAFFTVPAAADIARLVFTYAWHLARAQAAAARELLWHSAAALTLIVLLLALAFGHSRHVLLVLAALPSTLIGGVAAVALSGGTLSLGAMVGFVALFGMAARNTILLISHYQHLVSAEGERWGVAAALRGAEERLTPVLLTALLTALALLPVALQSRAPGHEIEGPMAVVILGGLISSTLVSLVLVPPLAARWLRPGVN